MIRKLCLLFFFALFSMFSFGQNQQILFGFDQLPQTLILNPGAEVGYDKHIGVPLLSNIYFQVGATNKKITYNNIFANTAENSDIIRNVYEKNLGNSDFFKINQKLEILNAGFRLKNPKYYLSFGIYQELDGYSSYPKQLVDLFFQGDYSKGGGVKIDEKSNFDNINFIGELIGVFHVGLSFKINEELNIGGRLKVLSGSLNVNSTNNKGHYVLNNGSPIYSYDHRFNQMGIAANSSGIINEAGNSVLGSSSEIIGGLFFMDGNIGLGLDLGLTYHASENIIVTASLLDLDYVNYGNKVVTYKVENDFNLQNDELFNPTDGSELGYWENVLDLEDLENSDVVPLDINNNSYKFYRSPKLNTSVKYQTFRENKENYNSVFRNARYVTPTKQVLVTEYGIQTFTAFRPNKVDWAITAFFSRELTKNFNTKITYTYDQFSAKNIGLGFSTHIHGFNFYATADNLLALYKVKDSNYQSLQLGMNYIFD